MNKFLSTVSNYSSIKADSCINNTEDWPSNDDKSGFNKLIRNIAIESLKEEINKS